MSLLLFSYISNMMYELFYLKKCVDLLQYLNCKIYSTVTIYDRKLPKGNMETAVYLKIEEKVDSTHNHCVKSILLNRYTSTMKRTTECWWKSNFSFMNSCSFHSYLILGDMHRNKHWKHYPIHFNPTQASLGGCSASFYTCDQRWAYRKPQLQAFV